MTCDSIGILDLQGIIETVLLELLQTVCLERDIGIVGHDTLVELVLLFTCQCRCLTFKRIKQYGGCEFIVVVIGEGHGNVSKVEAIEFLMITHATYHAAVTIGKEVRHGIVLFLLSTLKPHPIIIIPDNHKHVAEGQFSITVKDSITDALIIDVCPFVASCDDNGIVLPHPAIAGAQLVDEFVAHDDMDVGEGEANHW